jgi:SAM-dependent methyltransferase
METLKTLNTSHTSAMAAQRYRLPDNFIPRYTPEEIRTFVAGFPWGLGHMFRALPPRLTLQGKRVLDLGCGVTLQALEVIEKYDAAEYHGIDPDPDTFWGGHNDYDNYIGYKHAFAFYYPERVKFYNSISEDMPFPDNYFDFAFASQTTEHVQDIAGMCREVHRVLKPGGYIYATHHNFYAWDGHHQGPYFVKDLPNCSPEQMQFQHWRHIDMQRDWTEPHHLNRITLRELEAAFRASLHLVTWNNSYTPMERGLNFLTDEILAEFAGRYDYEDLATTMIEIVAKKDAM